MTKQVNIRLSKFHAELLKSIVNVRKRDGLNSSQAEVIKLALEHYVTSNPSLHDEVESDITKRILN